MTIINHSIISNTVNYDDGPACTSQHCSGACRAQKACELATDTFDCDVMVIGSGASGMATAINAITAGAQGLGLPILPILTILPVEQMAQQAPGVADRACVLETGTVTLEGSGHELLADPKVKAAYLGTH